MDCNILVSELELRWRYYVHFRTNTFGKTMETQRWIKIIPLMSFYKDRLGIELPDICLCLPPDRTWHKVNDPRVDYSGG